MHVDRKARHLSDAIKNVTRSLVSLDEAIQMTFDFDPRGADSKVTAKAAANEPKHSKRGRIALPDYVMFAKPDGSQPKPHENFLERINFVIEEEFGGSMNAFATAIGKNQKTLWVWLSKKSQSRNPTVGNIYEVCDLLGWDYFEAMSPLGSLDR